MAPCIILFKLLSSPLFFFVCFPATENIPGSDENNN